MAVTSEKYQAFFTGFPQRLLAKNDLLLKAAEPVDHFFYVEFGAIKMVKTTHQGRQLVLHIFFPGAFLPLLALNTQVNHYDFMAVIPSSVRVVPRPDLTRFLQSDISIQVDLQERLLRGIAGLIQRIEQLSLTGAENQVASLLLYFAKHFAQPGSATTQPQLAINITHQEIADWLGLSRENVSLHMKKLERRGLIETDDRLILIKDKAKLTQLAEAETT